VIVIVSPETLPGLHITEGRMVSASRAISAAVSPVSWAHGIPEIWTDAVEIAARENVDFEEE
jgi:hypothetical protein